MELIVSSRLKVGLLEVAIHFSVIITGYILSFLVFRYTSLPKLTCVMPQSYFLFKFLFRYLRQNKYEETLNLLYDGALVMFYNGQVNNFLYLSKFKIFFFIDMFRFIPSK